MERGILNVSLSDASFAMLPAHAGKPAPTLLLLAMAGADTLCTEPYCRVGRLLHAQGWNVVSLDLPCHGADRRAGEPTELAGWAARVKAGEDIVAAFQKRVNDVVGHLVTTGVTDPARIAAAGTSRGGFMAFHAAAGNPLIRAVAAFSPVTDLVALSEFAGQENNPLATRLALVNAAEALAGRAVWITIGNADERVGTDKAVTFAEALKNAALAQKLTPRVTLRVLPTPGHSSLPEWHDDAALWLANAAASVARILPGPDQPDAVPCTLYPPAPGTGKKAGLVIHLYGSNGSHTEYNLMRQPYAPLREALRANGYWLLVPDLGPRHWMNPRSAATLDAIIARLAVDGEIDPTRVHLLGTSMGAGSALIYAAQRAQAIRSLCAVFPMTDLAAWTREMPGYLEPIMRAHGLDPARAACALKALSPLTHAAELARMPIFLLHGDADGIVNVHHSRDLVAALRAAGGRAELHEVPGGGHDDGIAAGFQDRLFNFIHNAE
jgi:pimeloyl-ACP methyl ester carboxylesterase